ncbi:MAG: ABC-three component system middle component 8 [Rikenellaceae bacterium]
MLIPNKHTDIRYSILYLSGMVIQEIQQSGIIKYDDLKKSIINQVGKEVGDSFEYSLSFLYLINKITYNIDSDTITL